MNSSRLHFSFVAIGFLLASTALAQQAGTCIGRTCGRDQGFEIEHCHLRPGGDPNGNDICWSRLFDFACEEMGYTVSILCPVGVAGGGGGLVGSQVSTAFGGLGVFRNQAGSRATSRAELAAREAEAEGEEESEDEGRGGEEEEEERGRQAARFSQMTTALEHERWDQLGDEGDTSGARFSWLRQSETGVLVNLAASYQRAEPETGGDSDLVSATLGFGHLLGSRGTFLDWAEWRWTVNATASRLSGIDDLTLYGANAFFGFRKDLDNGHVFSGGVVGEFQTSDDLEDDAKSVGIGAAYGLPLGQRFALDLELYHVTFLDLDTDDDSFFTAAAQVSWYLSERFGLTLGYRTLEGIDGVDSRTFTLGSSTRF